MKILILILLVIMFVQDMKSRSILWPLFPVLAGLLLYLRFNSVHSVSSILIEAAPSLLCLIFMLIMVSLYLSARHKRWIKLTDGMIGWADLLLLVCLALYLPLLNYMLFFIGSSVMILVGWLGYQAFTRAKSPFIPFAGCQALLFGGLLIFSWASATNLFNDYWLFQLVSR